MKTKLDVEFVPTFTYALAHAEPVLVADEETVEPVPANATVGPGADVEPALDEELSDESLRTVEALDDVSKNDVGFFMALAGQFELLNAERERELGLAIWIERRRLVRALRTARTGERLRHTAPLTDHRRPISASSRRRLFRVEELARAQLIRSSATHQDDALRRVDESLRTIDLAKTELVEHNLRLVVWVAKAFRGRGFDFIDLIQEGNLGLMRAIDRFDPLFGARFSTFATHWIRQGIRRALAEKARTIRIPVNRISEVRETLRAQASLKESLGRRPTEKEVANAVGQKVEKVKELLPAIAPIDSIDAPMANTDRILSETIADLTGPTPLDIAIEEETKNAVQEVLHQLPERQRIILSMRHGIDYPKECTLEEIGLTLGLSRERIRQVEKQAAHRVKSLILQDRPKLAEM